VRTPINHQVSVTQPMKSSDHQLPNPGTLSILISVILLSYTLTHFVSIPDRAMELALLGVYFPITINFSTLVTLLVAGLAVSGSAWLLRHHPAAQASVTAEHWILPGLTALVLMTAVEQLSFGWFWWAAALGSGLILALVFTAEYISLDAENPYYLGAEIGIAALSLVLFMILAVALHAAQLRLFYRVPVLSISASLVFLRVLHVRHSKRWAVLPAAAVFLILGELAAGLHYWPLSSLSFGLALLGPLYALIEFTDQRLDQRLDQPLQIRPLSLLEPALILMICWAGAVLI